ncbi:hypothetical protein NDU88_001911 [Pleurodeles waltl]|uniref:Uncharacterized protein n=1 Tax=Pleurodeles waltl TaxID=8319 RepID=A0AAV7MP10_PLEWA|nr:hypothetical protein NDU88_001911 [Pleurodeles waltl]
MCDGRTHFCQTPEEAWSWLETYKNGTVQQNLHDSTPARRREKRRHYGERIRRSRVLGPTKTQASQGKQAAIQAAASLMESPSSDKDRLSHMDMGESGDSSDHESVVDPLGGLPHVTPQTAEDIIKPRRLCALAQNSAL